MTKRWGATVALDDVHLRIGPGVTGLVGANGAGKTTLIGLLLGLHAADSGRVRVLGQDVAVAGARVRQRLGYAPEHEALPPDTQALEFVRLIGELHGLPRRDAVTRATEAIDLVGLGEERLRPIGTLSLGQLRRVTIAQAVVGDPELVLLDEPTNGLDPLQRDRMLALIRRIGGELGMHVLVSSHLLGEIERVCTDVVVLDRGRVRAAGPVSAVTTDATGWWTVEVDGGLDLVAALAGDGLDARPAGPRRFLVLLDGGGDLDLLRDRIADAGAGLRRLERARVSLQQRFFGAVDDGGADRHASGDAPDGALAPPDPATRAPDRPDGMAR